jgi:hypothetical protein
VTRRLDSFGDFCGRARTLESSTNDSNLFYESFEESFEESFAHWVLKITKIHNLDKFWWKTIPNQFLQFNARIVTKNVCAEV